MCPLAARASAGFGEPPSILKNILTFEAFCRPYPKLHFLRNEGAPDMREMVIDLFLADAEGCGEVPSTVFIAGKQDYHLLPNGLHGSRLFRVYVTQNSMLC